MKKLLCLLLLLANVSASAQQIQFKNFPGMVFGDNAFGRSTNSITALDGAPSGFRTVVDNANLPAAFAFHEIRVKQALASSTANDWTWQQIAHFNTGAWYENYWNQTGQNNWGGTTTFNTTGTTINGGGSPGNKLTGLFKQVRIAAQSTNWFSLTGDVSL